MTSSALTRDVNATRPSRFTSGVDTDSPEAAEFRSIKCNADFPPAYCPDELEIVVILPGEVANEQPPSQTGVWRDRRLHVHCVRHRAIVDEVELLERRARLLDHP